ncbi:zinc finger protein 415-like isoform X2 [Pan troglodytes]|uniref:zinc finger protein 415-like isoform X2 n=1 Tax=Pan troglodytes TaxID=9598 RepID=UPI0007DBC5FB
MLEDRLEYNGTIMAHCSLKHPDSSDRPASVSQVAGTTRVSHLAQTISGQFFKERSPYAEASKQQTRLTLFYTKKITIMAITSCRFHKNEIKWLFTSCIWKENRRIYGKLCSVPIQLNSRTSRRQNPSDTELKKEGLYLAGSFGKTHVSNNRDPQVSNSCPS